METAPPPRAAAGFYKAHGLGNDYLVVEAGDAWTLDPAAVRAVCHRTRGAGSDGIVWVDPQGPPFALRMFNPDGSEFERSGNGLRVLASHLHRRGRVATDPFTVHVGGEEVTLQVLAEAGGTFDIAVEMGQCRVGPEAVALDPDLLEPGEREGEGLFRLGYEELVMSPVSVGNPHAVLWGDPLPWASLDPRGRGGDEDGEEGPAGLAALERVGPAVATHPGFGAGTNVQLARVEDPTRILALVWERGVGRTSASGTSACAVAVSAVATGRIPPGEVEVVMEGGSLRVAVTPSLEARLRGPVGEVMTGTLLPGILAPGDGGSA